MLTGMIADASRIRKGDQIIFYLQQNQGEKIFEGKFFGVFCAREDWSFLDNKDVDQYLGEELRKSLTFRTLIDPAIVYPKGVTEWEALDEIKSIKSPYQMLWSLIYRKLKGNRGNTMITTYEAKRLVQLIRNKNERVTLDCENKRLSFNLEEQEIVCNGTLTDYKGRKEDLNILPRLLQRYREKNKAFEAHLQAYIVKNLGKVINHSLDDSVLGSSEIDWLGNEVSCGVGMQRIDIMLSVTDMGQKTVIPIELKAVKAEEAHIGQIQRYVDWIRQYYIPNEVSDIQPILLTKKTPKKDKKSYQKLIDRLNRFKKENSKDCNPIKFIEFSLDGEDLLFELVSY